MYFDFHNVDMSLCGLSFKSQSICTIKACKGLSHNPSSLTGLHCVLLFFAHVFWAHGCAMFFTSSCNKYYVKMYISSMFSVHKLGGL